MDLRALSLFAGGGGLDLGLAACRTVCYVERDAQAAAVLVRGMEEGRLCEAPVWSDVSTFDGRAWRGVVDCIVGGFPCQDLSVAGKRAGIDGERSGLWGEFARIIGEVRPGYVFVENVAGLLDNRAMGRVLGDLAALGFDAEWGSVRASDAGAPHRRERVFLLAHCTAIGRTRLAWEKSAQRVTVDYPEWPPRPGDTEGWRRVLERWPELAPALGDSRRSAGARDTGAVSGAQTPGGGAGVSDGD